MSTTDKPKDALPHGLTDADLNEIVEVFRILLRWDIELKEAHAPTALKVAEGPPETGSRSNLAAPTHRA